MTLNTTVKHNTISDLKSACLIAGIFEQKKLSSAAKEIDQLCDGLIGRVVKKGDITGKPGQTLLLHTDGSCGFERVLLVGCGKEKELNTISYRNSVSAAINAIQDKGIKDAVCFLTDLDIKDRDTAAMVRDTAEAAHHALYQFDQLKSSDDNRPSLKKLILNVADKKDMKKAQTAVKIANAIANGVALARDLGNLPGNICTPSYLANQASKNAKSIKNMKARALNQKDIEKLGMGSFLSVAKGSREAPKFIIVEYNGGKKTDAPVVLVGKGITFDSGGISIKPSVAMDEMKFDMCGAASVLGTMLTVGELQLPINVVALVPSCENLPDGQANKPGDIVTSMSGQTIEILNTDAEGRLILCDALTYSKRYKPKAVIDVATLTGACVVALGKHAAGMLGNDDKLMASIKQASDTSGDRVWQLPMWDDYAEQLKSNFADLANIGGRDAGTITAACFLSKFATKLKWTHLDIAGVAWESGAEKGATGRPVPLLSQYLLDQAKGKIGV